MNGLRRPHSRPAPVGALRTWLPRLAAGISLAVTGVLAASMLADCSSTGAAGSAPSTVASVPRHATTTNEPNRDGPYAVGKRTLTFVDSTRKTPPNGNLPERQSRTLETIVSIQPQARPTPPMRYRRPPLPDSSRSLCTCTGWALTRITRTSTPGPRPDS